MKNTSKYRLLKFVPNMLSVSVSSIQLLPEVILIIVCFPKNS